MAEKDKDEPWSPRIPETGLFLNSADIEQELAKSADEEAHRDLDSEEAERVVDDGRIERETVPPVDPARGSETP